MAADENPRPESGSKGRAAMMDKDEFRAKLGEFFGQSNVQPVRKLEPDMVVICTLAKDFDPKNNELWDRWANKSKVRDDVRCCGCCESLAVSNWVYDQYVVMKEKPRLYCVACASEVLEKEKEKEADGTKPEERTTESQRTQSEEHRENPEEI
jgi:hypothetical protein